MKVAKLVAPRRMEIVEELEPVLLPGQVLVRVTAVGICGSDLHYFRHGGLGTHISPLPMELGHEVSGVVATPNSTRWKDGQAVFVEPLLSCGGCDYCKLRRSNLCAASTFLGGGGQPGGFREYLVVDQRQLRATPDPHLGFLEEPCAVARHAVSRAGYGRKVLIIGAGPLGFLIGERISRLSDSALTFVDKLDYRLERAADQLRASRVYVPGSYETVFDAAGTQEAIDRAFDAALPGAEIVLVGIPETDFVRYNPHIARIKELDIFNVRRSPFVGEYAIVTKKAIDLITHRFPLSRVQEAFEVAADYKDNAMKVVVDPGAE